MKKLALLIISLLVVAPIVDAGWFISDDYEEISISTTNSNVSATTQRRYQIDKPANGVRTCLTDVSVSASGFNSPFTLSILQGEATTATTNYMIDVTTTPFIASWPQEHPLCLTPGTTAFFQLNMTSGTWKLNGYGFYKKAKN